MAANPASELAKQRRKGKGTCEVCGTGWDDSYMQRRYCSSRCRMQAYLKRKEKRERAAKREARRAAKEAAAATS